jgi:hypothetical protein
VIRSTIRMPTDHGHCAASFIQNSVELLDDSIDIKLERPLPSQFSFSGRDSGSSRARALPVGRNPMPIVSDNATPIRHPTRSVAAAASCFLASDRRGRSAPAGLCGSQY